jgi:parvulin-like peptidyl-prolyl isomerase
MKISINQEDVPEAVIRREMQNIQKQQPGTDEAQAFEQVSNNIIEWTLIRQQAETHITVDPKDIDAEFEHLCKQHGGQEAFLKRFGMDPSNGEHVVKEDIKRHRQSTRFMDELTKDVEPPEDAMVEAYYRTHSNAFVCPEQVHAAHIVKHPQGEAAENAAAAELTSIRKRLLAGADFLKVAEECSECNDSAPDLGTFPRGKMVPEFEIVVFSMNPGEISPVFKTPFGLHVATVFERLDPAPMTLGEAKPQIRQTLLQEARNKTIREWVTQQKEKADLEISPPTAN